MAHPALFGALSALMATQPVPSDSSSPGFMPAPAAGPDAEYCMYVEPVTGSRIETVQCWTRAEWAEAGVDIDKDWAKEGVAIIEGGIRRPVRG
ncbi:MAG: hypothetical protein ACJ8E0_08515 [Sphingomicrobium sp.]